uniref:Uncharacterized protein n=1 Tax=Physcomitrium patens TaxID=3218 RepID=A0A7I3YXW7_PHYPA
TNKSNLFRTTDIFPTVSSAVHRQIASLRVVDHRHKESGWIDAVPFTLLVTKMKLDFYVYRVIVSG